MDPNNMYGPAMIVTSNIFDDIKRYFYHGEEVTVDDVRSIVAAQGQDARRKLYAVTERFEFVEHLLSLKDILVRFKQTGDPVDVRTVDDAIVLEIPEEIEFEGQEFNGFDHDIEANCFYLLLTCIETITGANLTMLD